MTVTQMRSQTAAKGAQARTLDLKLEVVVIPVSDVERSKKFYERIGWRLDVDRSAGEDFRLVQFTPPGSRCSVHFGKNVTSAAPGSAKAFLIVSDVVAARPRAEKELARVYNVFNPEQLASGASILQSLADTGKMDTAVKLLGLMQERQAAKVLAELNDTKLAAQLLEKLKTLRKPPTATAAGTVTR